MPSEYLDWMEERRRVAARLRRMQKHRCTLRGDLLILGIVALLVGALCAWAL